MFRQGSVVTRYVIGFVPRTILRENIGEVQCIRYLFVAAPLPRAQIYAAACNCVFNLSEKLVCKENKPVQHGRNTW